MAWRVIENAPENHRWEAITVAAVARTTIGSTPHDGKHQVEGVSGPGGIGEHERAFARSS